MSNFDIRGIEIVSNVVVDQSIVYYSLERVKQTSNYLLHDILISKLELFID